MSREHWMFLFGIYLGILYGVYGHKAWLEYRERRWQRLTQGVRRTRPFDYNSPEYIKDNPCTDNFMECEGDCDVCPNKAYFAGLS